jgi:anti-sigma regulatory factor (Ser/Thr protein kinase)/putative methionine-R-sulfoxide reductase with GAF domain
MPSERAEERLHALQRVSDAALSYLPLEEMLDELLVRVRELLDADTAAILLLDRASHELVARAAKGLEEEVRRGVRIPMGRGFAGRIAAERRPVIIDDIDKAEVVNPILREKGIRSLLGVPLLVEGDIIGVLHVGSLSGRPFGNEDVEVLQAAGDRAALAIQGRLAERERGLMDALQRSLMGRLPGMPGVSLAGRYLPAASAQLGGDWYDAFLLKGSTMGIAIGDVVGRGFHAAALMGQLRAALRAYSLDGYGPGEVLTRLSRLLRALEPGWSATLLYICFEPLEGRATLASAGHPPPLLVSPEGKSDYITVPGSVPLGGVRFPRYEEVSVEVPPGAGLVLYTDGIVERRGEPLDEGLTGLRELVDDEDGDAEKLCDRVLDGMLPAGSIEDDAALLVAATSELPNPLELRLPADPDLMPMVRQVLGAWLRDRGASRAEVEEISLASAEACANAIEHAYSPGLEAFEVHAARDDTQVAVTIRDFGQWRAPRGTNRGRGMVLMEGLMDEVDVKRGERGSSVRMVRELRAAA